VRRAAFAVATVVALTLGEPQARADLQFTQPVVNLGEVRSGTPLVHDFPFTNAGPDVVEISDVQGSCGCLKPNLQPRSYKPGEQGTLRVEANTLTQSAGPHLWRIRVNYRSGNIFYEMQLMMSARIITEVTVQPASLTVFADHAVGHELLLTDLRPQPLSIKEMRATSPKLTPRLADEFRDGFGRLVRKISLEVADDFPEGRHEEVLDIFTDDATYKDLKVPVTIVKRSRQRFSAAPSSVSLLAPSGQAVPARIVQIRDSENGAVLIDKVTTADDAILCQWARGPNNLATLRISVDRRHIQGDHWHGSLQVHIKQPVDETVTIPVSVTVQ
jgi:hypothetical protein